VVENADNCVHITMPADPTGSNELSDEELSNAAGGVINGADIDITMQLLTHVD
jgi:mersacidin/lichenicidin family type 2 lantibiotic